MYDKLPIIKIAAKLIAGVGVTKVVNGAVLNNTTIQTALDPMKVWIGRIVLGSIVLEATSRHVDSQIDSAVAWYESHKDSPDSTNSASAS